ncbi:NAD(P)-dependent dehydrogenase, short-chain alcohol dehydrogenase family [Saccharopolyspora kobensis]|uniref:NAD(P)-dependent dehydrogenase, short-chain alcohol dehydrogenase family n=1 Tax=Saccharopolyspora kobensis TaxID=146035 RepID=A0A1H5USD1_9PSEU|nr:glucose 1-dehydrogenase [Saccharopolyspora kobensis]SEF77341.1 NAD(P)-dependent dehydrogenase, short-chain alcohol dehydrogenase family [Saccharopolyspora kobensis]SFC70695.1 NAD(P)-dependent dehydrogenase, short-chain alcohol dehydrogenase family [Saccharopolyspora kobensis]
MNTARFESKVVLVTGATSGIGEATSRRLAAEGAAVVLGARSKDVGEQLAADIRATGGRALFVPTDVTVESEVEALVRAAVDEFGRLDGAFNNAGAINAFGAVQDIVADGWQADIALNLSSVYFGLKHQVPAILASGGGAILNNASNLGLVGMGSVSPYVAAKHGVVGLTKAVALENAARGIRVNAISPAAVDTPAFRSSMGATPEGEAQIAALHPVGRISQPEEIAAFAAFLLSDEASFITGASLSIDGGFTTQ